MNLDHCIAEGIELSLAEDRMDMQLPNCEGASKAGISASHLSTVMVKPDLDVLHCIVKESDISVLQCGYDLKGCSVGMHLHPLPKLLHKV